MGQDRPPNLPQWTLVRLSLEANGGLSLLRCFHRKLCRVIVWGRCYMGFKHFALTFHLRHTECPLLITTKVNKYASIRSNLMGTIALSLTWTVHTSRRVIHIGNYFAVFVYSVVSGILIHGNTFFAIDNNKLVENFFSPTLNNEGMNIHERITPHSEKILG